MLKNLSNSLHGAALLIVLAACSSTPTAPVKPDVVADTTQKPAPTVATASNVNAPATSSALATSITVQPKALVALNATLQSKFDEGLKALDAKQYERALQLFAAIQIAQPNYSQAYLNAALAERARGKLDAARTQLDGAMTAGVQDARVYALMGLIERERGQFAAAKSAYEQALKLDASSASTHRNLAVLADLYLHDAVLAYEHMNAYVQLSPDDKQAAGWLAELKRRAGVKTESVQ